MTNLMHKIFNTFITILYMYMFRTISCSSSGSQILSIQHLVSSLSVSDRPVHKLRKNCYAGLSQPVHWPVTYWEWRYQPFSTCAPDRPVHRLRKTCLAVLSQPVHWTVTYWEWRY